MSISPALLVDILSMTDSDNIHTALVFQHTIHHSIITKTNPPKMILSLKLARASRMRFVSKCLNLRT